MLVVIASTHTGSAFNDILCPSVIYFENLVGSPYSGENLFFLGPRDENYFSHPIETNITQSLPHMKWVF
jgi:hypothetical protein